MNKYTDTCRNCRNIGHLYKDCPHPITSFGIICYKINPETNKLYYLMIQRKDSLCFMEFIRGKYELKNHSYIRNLLSGMTIEERKLLLELDFDTLWNHVWYQTNIPKQTSEYLHAKNKFENLVKGGATNKKITLQFLLDSSVSPYEHPEWGFPKGRRKIHEEDIKCAIREYVEETNIPASLIEIDAGLSPFEETFYGTNNILYRHVYYVAKLVNYTDTLEIEVDPTNINQAREVKSIKWLEYEQVLSYIREHNVERKNLIQLVDKLLKDKMTNTGKDE